MTVEPKDRATLRFALAREVMPACGGGWHLEDYLAAQVMRWLDMRGLCIVPIKMTDDQYRAAIRHHDSSVCCTLAYEKAISASPYAATVRDGE